MLFDADSVHLCYLVLNSDNQLWYNKNLYSIILQTDRTKWNNNNKYYYDL